MKIAALVSVFLAVVFAVIAVYQIINARRLQIMERIQRYGELTPTKEEMEAAGMKEAARSVSGTGQRRSFWQRLGIIRRYLNYLERELAKTAILLRPEEFAVGAVGTGAGLFLLLYLLGTSLFLTILISFGGFYVWHFMLARAKTKRIQAFNRQIVGALDLISSSLKAGYSFLQAVEMVAGEMDPPIATEFRRLLRETKMGISQEEALMDMGQRVDNEDMDLVVTAILIQRQVGGNLAEVLEGISHTIRERIRLKNELKSLTAQGKLSGLIVMLLPPGVALLIFMSNPQFLGVLFMEPVGRVLLVLAVFMQILGIVLIRRIINLEV